MIVLQLLTKKSYFALLNCTLKILRSKTYWHLKINSIFIFILCVQEVTFLSCKALVILLRKWLLIELTLVLPVATASVERAFSAMNIIKSPLRNRMGDQWLNDSLVVYIEKYVFSCIDNETIMTRFHSMRSRRGQI